MDWDGHLMMAGKGKEERGPGPQYFPEGTSPKLQFILVRPPPNDPTISVVPQMETKPFAPEPLGSFKI